MDNYSILNLKSGATIIEIKSRFRVLCKQYHPDKTGGDKAKTAQFLIIKDAYEALLKGDSGSQNKTTNNYSKQSKDSNFKGEKKKATYKFITIRKDKKGYLISFKLQGVNEVWIRGKNYNSIGTYDVRHVDGVTNLRVKFEDAKKAKYMFRILLYDGRGYYAEETYKVKSPSFFDKFTEWFK